MPAVVEKSVQTTLLSETLRLLDTPIWRLHQPAQMPEVSYDHARCTTNILRPPAYIPEQLHKLYLFMALIETLPIPCRALRHDPPWPSQKIPA